MFEITFDGIRVDMLSSDELVQYISRHFTLRTAELERLVLYHSCAEHMPEWMQMAILPDVLDGLRKNIHEYPDEHYLYFMFGETIVDGLEGLTDAFGEEDQIQYLEIAERAFLTCQGKATRISPVYDTDIRTYIEDVRLKLSFLQNDRVSGRMVYHSLRDVFEEGVFYPDSFRRASLAYIQSLHHFDDVESCNRGISLLEGLGQYVKEHVRAMGINAFNDRLSELQRSDSTGLQDE